MVADGSGTAAAVLAGCGEILLGKPMGNRAARLRILELIGLPCRLAEIDRLSVAQL